MVLALCFRPLAGAAGLVRRLVSIIMYAGSGNLSAVVTAARPWPRPVLAPRKRLGLHTALPQHSFALFQPDLSELLHRVIARVLSRIPGEWPPPGTLTTLGRLLAFAGGRAVWSKHLAPP